MWRDALEELHVQYPDLGEVSLGEVVDASASESPVLVAVIVRSQPLEQGQKQQIVNWLKVRTKTQKAKVIVTTD